MKKTLLLLPLLILLSTMVYSQIEPTVTNISYINNAGFIFGVTTDATDCVGISSTKMWCYTRLQAGGEANKIIYLYDTATNTLTNPYNITGFESNLAEPCVYYPSDNKIYCVTGNQNNATFKVDIATSSKTSLENSPQSSTHNICDLKPNSDVIYCTGEDQTTGFSFIRVYNITSNTWTTPINILPFFDDISTGLQWTSCDFVSDDVWVCYGGYSSGTTSDDIIEYQTSTNTTTTIQTGQDFYAGICHAVNSILYCYAGDGYPQNATLVNAIYYYDYTTNTFGTLTATLPIGFASYGDAGKIGNSFYNLGGFAGDNYDYSNDMFQLTFCVPNWSCTGYQTCVSPMVNASCNYVTDLNTCGDVYDGNYSEFTPQICSYPPPITGYVPAHSSLDIPAVIIDFGVEFGMVMIAFVGIIVIIGLGTVAIKLFKK